MLGNWTWADESTVTTGKIADYPARYTVDDVTYDYTDVEGYNAEGHYVERMVKITVEPAKKKKRNWFKANQIGWLAIYQQHIFRPSSLYLTLYDQKEKLGYEELSHHLREQCL